MPGNRPKPGIKGSRITTVKSKLRLRPEEPSRLEAERLTESLDTTLRT